MSRLLKIFISSTAIAIAGISVSTYAIDPWGQFATKMVVGINTSKPELRARELVYKFDLASRKRWRTILLGTSRLKHGIDPSLSFPNDDHVVNLGTDLQAYEISYALYEKALQHSGASLKQVIWGIDFFEANATLRIPAVPPGSAIGDGEAWPWRTLFSLSAFGASMKTLGKNVWDHYVSKGRGTYTYHLENGFQEFTPGMNLKEEITHSNWSAATKTYLPPPQRKFEFSSGDKNPMTYMSMLIRSAYDNGVEVAFFIAPSHAQQWEVIAGIGLWETWERWKRMVVKLVEDEAARAGKPAFKVYDFSGYGRINAEKVPPLDEKNNTMEYYWEPNHYRPNVGRLVTDKILGIEAVEGFGQQITSANIEFHLASIRREQAAWRIVNAEEYREVNAICQKAISSFNLIPTQPGSPR